MNAQVVMFVITSEGPVSFMQIEYHRCTRDVLLFRFSLFYFLLIELSLEIRLVKTAKRAKRTNCLSNLLTVYSVGI